MQRLDNIDLGLLRVFVALAEAEIVCAGLKERLMDPAIFMEFAAAFAELDARSVAREAISN